MSPSINTRGVSLMFTSTLFVLLNFHCTEKEQQSITENQSPNSQEAPVKTKPLSANDRPVKLVFVMVNEEMMKQRDAVKRAIGSARQTTDALSREAFLDDNLLSTYLTKTSPNLVPQDSLLRWEYEANPKSGKKQRMENKFYVIYKNAKIQETDIQSVDLYDALNSPYAKVDLKPKAQTILQQITTDNIGSRLAIILNDRILSTLVIKEQITGGQLIINLEISNQAEALQATKSLVDQLNNK
jgi:preprotein translocase subunit SecD